MTCNARARLKVIFEKVCFIAAFQFVGLAEPVYGQFGFDGQMWLQQWSQQQQAKNYGFERMWAMQQKAIYRSMYGDQTARQQRARIERSYHYDSPQPQFRRAVMDPIQAGETVMATHRSTPVMVGFQQVAKVDPGIAMSVIQREGEWLGIHVTQNGETVSGWIHVRHARRIGR